MSTLSEASKIYNVYKTFNETAAPDLKTSVKDPVQREPPVISSKPTLAEHLTPFDSIFISIWLVTKTKVKVIKFFKDTSFTAHLCRQCFEMAILDACWMRCSGYCSSSSISSRRGPYSRTYAICQSPPPDSRRISSGDTTLTLSSSNLNHSSSRGREETSTLNAPLDFHTYASTLCRQSTVGCFTFFPLDPSHIVTR